ncbi:MAG TPA: hypothetical protein VJZ27_16015 [Aggregatilineales bacterium]|nr:hypothetical protein [Aggregatilineales bacterium]
MQFKGYTVEKIIDQPIILVDFKSYFEPAHHLSLVHFDIVQAAAGIKGDAFCIVQLASDNRHYRQIVEAFETRAKSSSLFSFDQRIKIVFVESDGALPQFSTMIPYFPTLPDAIEFACQQYEMQMVGA